MALKVVNVRLEAITIPHLNREEVMVVLFVIPARGILSEERFDYLLEDVERMWW